FPRVLTATAAALRAAPRCKNAESKEKSEVAKTLRALPAFTCTTVAHPGEIPVEVFELDPQLLSEVRNSNPAVAIPPPAPPAKRSSGRTELPLPPGKVRDGVGRGGGEEEIAKYNAAQIPSEGAGEFALALVGSGGESSAKGLADADAEREPSASGALEVMRQARRAVEEMERLLETRHGRALGASAVTANTVAYLCQRREAATVRCILAHEARIRAVVERLIAEVVRPCCDADAEQEAARGLAEKAANLFGEMRNAVDWPFPEGGGR
ncbi:MAG: hypothetical protein BJ554DRAFT_1507, partial [Olpidium bornovanus]